MLNFQINQEIRGNPPPPPHTTIQRASAAAHTTPPPGLASLSLSPHHRQCGERLVGCNLSEGGSYGNNSIPAKIRGNPLTRTQQSKGIPPPPKPLPNPVGHVESAQCIIGDAVCARFGSIQGRGGDSHLFQHHVQNKPPPLPQQFKGIQPPPEPLPHPVRHVEPAHCIMGNAVCARLGLI